MKQLSPRLAFIAALTLVAAGSLTGCVALLATGAVVGAASVAHDQRTAGAIVDDQAIELKAEAAFKSDRDLFKEAHLSVTSYNGIVLLTGEVPDEELHERATDLVHGIDRVREVHNEATLGARSSLSARAADTVLTGKVKARLLGTRGFDSTRVKVVSDGGVVYLMGLVTRDEAETAIDVARTTDGVQRVVRIFEYRKS